MILDIEEKRKELSNKQFSLYLKTLLTRDKSLLNLLDDLDLCNSLIALKHEHPHRVLNYYFNNALHKCSVCGKLCKVQRDTCSKKCQSLSVSVIEKRKATNKKRYGTEYSFQSSEIKEKIKDTNLERYGVQYSSQCDKIKQKVRDTNLALYGTEYSFQSNEIKEKIKATNLERYGVENPMHIEEIKQRVKNTCIKRYGVQYSSQCNEIKQRVKNTCIKRYGVENPMHIEEIKQRVKNTCIKRYGVDNYFKSDDYKKACIQKYGVLFTFKSKEIQQKIKDTNLERYGCMHDDVPRTYMQRNYTNTDDLTFDGCQRFIHNGLFDIIEFAEYFNMSVSNAYKYKRKLNITEPCSLEGTSKAERDLADFIQNVLDDLCAKHKIPKVNVLKNDRSVINPLELDIYIPDLKLAVEYNGIYWHSLKDKFYHQSKSLLCYNKGIRLIHVYEEIDDFDSIKKLLKTVITSKLSNEHLCVTQESFKESLKIDLSKDDPFIHGYSIKEILEPIQISENLYNAGYLVLVKNI